MHRTQYPGAPSRAADTFEGAPRDSLYSAVPLVTSVLDLPRPCFASGPVVRFAWLMPADLQCAGVARLYRWSGPLPLGHGHGAGQADTVSNYLFDWSSH